MSRTVLQGTCIDAILPPEYLARVADLAAAERHANTPIRPRNDAGEPDSQRLAVQTKKMWTQGRTLRVRFMDGDQWVRDKVFDVAGEWTCFANIHFERSEDPDAEIRVTFLVAGYSSLIGVDSQAVKPERRTMTLGGLSRQTADDEYHRVVLHEFGHTLGCIHEHSNPAGGIPWDVDAVYAFYAETQSWDRETTDLNIFKRYAKDETQFSAFDRDSIMLYPIAADLTGGRFEVGFNRELSAVDKAFIGSVYPQLSPALVDLTVDAAKVPAEVAKGGQQNEFRFAVTVAGMYVIETSGIVDTEMVLCGPDSITRRIAEDDESGLGRNARIEEVLMKGAYFVRVGLKSPTGTGRYTIGVTSRA